MTVLQERYLHKKHLNEGIGEARTLYRETEYCRERRMLDVHGGDPDKQLSGIAQEIQLRVKITQQEIYLIGEMLVQAREILKGTNESFQAWVERNFDFGYHTACNFCNVYTACMGQLNLIRYVKPSILYLISSKQFPEELRDILLFNDLLQDFSIRNVKEIYEEFQEKGFEAVKSTLEQIANKSLITEHAAPFIDNLNKTSYFIDNVIEKVSRDPIHKNPLQRVKGATEIGDEIAGIVLDSLEQCSKILKDAKTQIGNTFKNNQGTDTSFIEQDDTAVIEANSPKLLENNTQEQNDESVGEIS